MQNWPLKVDYQQSMNWALMEYGIDKTSELLMLFTGKNTQNHLDWIWR